MVKADGAVPCRAWSTEHNQQSGASWPCVPACSRGCTRNTRHHSTASTSGVLRLIVGRSTDIAAAFIPCPYRLRVMIDAFLPRRGSRHAGGPVRLGPGRPRGLSNARAAKPRQGAIRRCFAWPLGAGMRGWPLDSRSRNGYTTGDGITLTGDGPRPWLRLRRNPKTNLWLTCW